MDIIDLTSSPPAPVRSAKHSSKLKERTKSAEALLRDPLSPTISHGTSIDGQYSPTTEWMREAIHEPSPWDELFWDSDHKRSELPTFIEEYGADDPSWYSHGSKKSKATQPSTSGSKRTATAQAPSVKAKGKTTTDFVVLSDDENTISLDKIFNLESGPAAKRRRLSPKSASSVSAKTTTCKGISQMRATSAVRAASVTTMATSRKPTAMEGTTKRILDDDPIVFTSSPDVLRVARDRKGKQRYGPAGDSACDDLENHNHFGKRAIDPGHRQRVPLKDISSDLELPDLGTIASKTSISGMNSSSRGNANNALEAYNAEKAAQKKARKNESKGQDKSRSVEERLEAKEVEKERKLKEKEHKAREKQRAADLAKVNTLRTDKKISTPEMIIDLPAELESRLTEQLRQFLGPLDVECREWNSPIRNVIKWRRKVEAIYNEEMEHWEPAPRQIKAEKHVMCVMNANEFVDLTVGEEGKDLDAHAMTMKAKFDDCAIIYLIEGLTAWMRKNKNVKNRAFTQAVRNQMAQDGVEVGPTSQRAKKKTQEYVDEDMIEDALLKLQVIHGMLIHHTTATTETAEWVTVFTQHISTIPYRHASLALNTSFCMAPGQVSTGINTPDTFLKMLQEINRITAPISYGVAGEYDSATKLVEGFEAHGKDMLMDVRKSANKDGAVSDRTVGKSVSRRLYGIFTGRDEGSHDV